MNLNYKLTKYNLVIIAALKNNNNNINMVKYM